MQKTLEDYRTIAKLLKLDILRVKVSTDDLRKRLGQAPSTDGFAASTIPETVASRDFLTSLYQSMHLFLREISRLELTPEMLFRMIDEAGRKQITVDRFASAIAKLKLRLEKDHVDQLCLQFDLSKNGTIELSHYLATVAAFQISTEPFPPGNKGNYGEVCFGRLAWFCRQKSADLSIFDSSKPTDFVDFKKLIQKQIQAISDVELIAIYLMFDKSRQFRIPTEEFYRRLTEQVEEVRAGRRKQYEGGATEPTRGALDKRPKALQPRSSEDGLKERRTNDADENNRPKPIAREGSPKSAQPVEVILAEARLNFELLFQQLLKTAIDSASETAPLQRSFVLGQVRDMLGKSSSRQLSGSQTFAVFRDMDAQQDGSVSVLDLCLFFRRHRRPKDSQTPLIATLAYIIEATGVTPLSFLESAEVGKESRISLAKFCEVFADFNWNQQEFEPVYNEIKGSSPTLTGAKLIEQLNKYSSLLPSERSIPPPPGPRSSTALTLKQLRSMEADWKALPTSISSNYLQKKQLNKKPSELPYWKTIFTSEAEAFRFCYTAMQDCVEKREKGSTNYQWKDPQFGSSAADPHGMESIGGTTSNTMKFIPSATEVEWMRADVYVAALNERLNTKPSSPFFMHEDLKLNDVIPSAGFGNHWLVMAMGFLTNYRNLVAGPSGKSASNGLLEGIYPPLFQLFAPYGMYIFRFFKDKQPVYVAVDNTLPVKNAPLELLFSHSSDPNCMWASLFEKAYAKLHGSYANIQFGSIQQALTDFTGFASTKTEVPQLNSEAELDFWKSRLEAQLRQGWLLGCSASKVKKSSNGIAEQSVYSIVSLIEIPDSFRQNAGKSYKLICLRNPQPNSEWRGEWSEFEAKSLGKQAKLPKNMKIIQESFRSKNEQRKKGREDAVEGYVIKEGDGTFLMDLRAWFEVFDTLHTVVVERSTTRKMRTKEVWGPVMSGGMPTTAEAAQNFYRVNFSYKLEALGSTDIVLQLSQKDGRRYEGIAYPYQEVTVPLALLVVRSSAGNPPESYSKRDVVQQHQLERRRSIVLSFKAEKAVYYILPWYDSFQFSTEEQHNQKPYPEFCLDAIYQGSSIRLPPTFREAEPTPTKPDPRVESLYRKLSELVKLDSTFRELNG